MSQALAVSKLTQRSRDVMILRSCGLYWKQIAALLGISKLTVGYHIRRGFKTLGIKGPRGGLRGKRQTRRAGMQ
jgi:DNA-binding NarL/FixJ family response regulator